MKRFACVLLAWTVMGIGVAVGNDACQCCDHCGCSAPCCKVCRCVPSTKKVPKTEWTCECEEFCVPGPSDHCVACDECGHKKHVFTPTCATMRTRKKAVKHETVQEVCTYKWVVENVCCKCAAKADAESQTTAVVAAPASNGDYTPVHYQEPAENAAPAAASRAVPGVGALKTRLHQVFDPLTGQGATPR